MPSDRRRPHILVPGKPSTEGFTPHPPFLPPKALPLPKGGRHSHGAKLKAGLLQVVSDGLARRAAVDFEIPGAKSGVYVEFESAPGIPLNIGSLENQTKRIEVVAVTEARAAADADGAASAVVQRATVFVPEGQVKHFIERFEDYAKKQPQRKGEPRHHDMLDRVAGLRLATLRALWTDDPETYPKEKSQVWWEVWLRRTDGKELERLHGFAAHVNLKVSERRIQFDDRIVILVCASARALSSSLDVLNDVAEVRRAKELAGFFVEQGTDAGAWANDLAGRLVGPHEDAPAVCVLDTGISRGHPLIKPALEPADLHAVHPVWNVGDHDGHGTEMAGLALYGDLPGALASADSVALKHRLESVKILPPPSRGSNDPDLYGAVTATAVSYPWA